MFSRLHISLGLLSVSVIAYQLVLMHILSIVQWHHFAFLVISVALLGFGASGTVLSLGRTFFIRRGSELMPFLMVAAGLAMSAGVWASQQEIFRFDSYRVFLETTHAVALALTCILFFAPFFLAALTLGIAFVSNVERIGVLYFWNLSGSALGGIIAVLLMWEFMPEELPAVVGVLAVASGVLIVPRRPSMLWVGFVLASAAGIAIALLNPPTLYPSEYKSLSRTLTFPDAEIRYRSNSPYGLVEVASSASLRYAPGVSLTYLQAAPAQDAMYNNGDWFGPILSWHPADTVNLLDYTTMALPYAMMAPRSVLLPHSGTGLTVAHALHRKARRVVAVESNTNAIAVLKNVFSNITSDLFESPAVEAVGMDPRTFLTADTSSYNLIALPMLESFGGTGGVFALREQYTLTVEAFLQMWGRLTPEGMLAVSSWMDYPFRSPLKLLATVMEMLDGAGVQDPAAHLAAVRSWGTVTIVATRSPVTTEAVASIRKFAEEMRFDVLLVPGMEPSERERYNHLMEKDFFAYVDTIVSPGRERLYAAYDFNIRPATDQRPYFSQFLRWQSLPQLSGLLGERAIPFLEIGYLIVVAAFVVVSVLALLLIVLPLLPLRTANRAWPWTVLYFGGLGVGFMFVEIVMIQRFVLYFGDPIHAAAAVIGGMLLCSGAGSFISARLQAESAVLWRIPLGVAALVLLYSGVFTGLLHSTAGLPIAAKAVVALILIAPPAVLMGMLFPLGLRRLQRTSEALVPWAWGVNGSASVVSSVLATVIAVEAGFAVVMIAAAAAYGVAATATVLLPGKRT